MRITRTVGLEELRDIVKTVRTRLMEQRQVRCAFPNPGVNNEEGDVSIVWSDGQDHEVILNVATGQVTAGGGRGFHWEEGRLE